MVTVRPGTTGEGGRPGPPTVPVGDPAVETAPRPIYVRWGGSVALS
jgi:hypothetical protein